MNTPTINSKSCPECGGLPGVYPNNVCPTCYVKRHLEHEGPTISEQIREILGEDDWKYTDKPYRIEKLLADFAERITPENDAIDKLLELLYNTGWVEGSEYKGDVDEAVRSPKELRRCEQTRTQLKDLITQNVKAELGAAPKEVK